MTDRRIIIGDVHGHYETLIKLIEAIAPGKNDQVYFLGDLIDRGPQSAEVVKFVIKNNYKCILGNHEQMLIDAVGEGQVHPEKFQGWLYSGGNATVISYDKKIPQEHIDWMRTLPKYIDLGDLWLVHAGVDPNIPLSQQTHDQFCWIRDEFHGITKPYFPDKLIITGHTITFTLPGIKPGKIAAGPGWLNIETGAYHPHSGWLTALDFTRQQVYQVNTQDGILRILPFKKAIQEFDPKTLNTKRLKLRL